MDIAAKTEFMPQDIGGIQQLILCPYSSARDAWAKKGAFGNTAAVQFHEYACKFSGFEGGAAEITAGAEGTIIAIPFAGRGEQGLQ